MHDNEQNHTNVVSPSNSELLAAENLQNHSRYDDNNDSGIRKSGLGIGLWQLAIPIFALVVGVICWAYVHGLWNAAYWHGDAAFPPFGFVADGPVGRAIELIFWVNCSVQLRWIGIAPNASNQNKYFWPFFKFWIYDTLETPFVCGLLIIFLQSLTLSFGSGLSVSLSDADIVLFSAVAAILGMSVRESRALLTRVTGALFNRFGDTELNE